MGTPGKWAAELVEATVPLRSDVVRAKRAIFDLLVDGKPHIGREIVANFLGREQIALPPGEDEHIPITTDEGFDPQFPPIRRAKAFIALSEAVSELSSAGTIVTVIEPNGFDKGPWPHFPPPHLHWDWNQKSGFPLDGFPRVDFDALYRLSHPLMTTTTPWFYDADILAEGMKALGLAHQSMRALREAVDAFRRGLYLSCMNLLGGVSEAAWYRLAETLADANTKKLNDAIKDERTADVQRLSVDVISQKKPAGWKQVHELLATASYLRELRNYGVHPNDQDSPDLERHFTEECCSALLLNFHRYLTQLSTLASGSTP